MLLLPPYTKIRTVKMTNIWFPLIEGKFSSFNFPSCHHKSYIIYLHTIFLSHTYIKYCKVMVLQPLLVQNRPWTTTGHQCIFIFNNTHSTEKVLDWMNLNVIEWNIHFIICMWELLLIGGGSRCNIHMAKSDCASVHMHVSMWRPLSSLQDDVRSTQAVPLIPGRWLLPGSVRSNSLSRSLSASSEFLTPPIPYPSIPTLNSAMELTAWPQQRANHITWTHHSHYPVLDPVELESHSNFSAGRG